MRKGAPDSALKAFAFVWGFAEAIFFFVVPDALLTFIAQRRGFRTGLLATVFAIAGACVGGALMWWLGRDYGETTLSLLDKVLAVSPEMIARAGPALDDAPLAALVKGAFSGVPYKVFAATAAGAGISLPTFLALTIPARAARFVLMVALTTFADRIVSRWLSQRTRTAILIGGWVIFYAVYWFLMPN